MAISVDPLESPVWEAVAENYLKDHPIVFDQDVVVGLPPITEDQTQVPVTIDARKLDTVDGIEQTRRWLDVVDDQITSSFNRGLDEIETMAEPMPEWTSQIAVGQFEYQRSVMHLTPKVELAKLPILARA